MLNVQFEWATNGVCLCDSKLKLNYSLFLKWRWRIFLYFLVEEGLGREGVEDGSNILTVDHRNREIGRTAGTAEGISEIWTQKF